MLQFFVNQQKINPIWDYEQSTQISFQEEGIYKVHIVHKNGYEEIRQVMVELNNPTTAKITAGRILQEHGAKECGIGSLWSQSSF